jgi:hypothetical protein
MRNRSIEMFQCRAARIVINRQRNTSSVGDWCSPQDKCKDARPVMKYKIGNENVDISKQDRLKPSLRQSRSMHYSSSIIPPCKTKLFLFLVQYLTETVVLSGSILPFMAAVSSLSNNHFGNL